MFAAQHAALRARHDGLIAQAQRQRAGFGRIATPMGRAWQRIESVLSLLGTVRRYGAPLLLLAGIALTRVPRPVLARPTLARLAVQVLRGAMRRPSRSVFGG